MARRARTAVESRCMAPPSGVFTGLPLDSPARWRLPALRGTESVLDSLLQRHGPPRRPGCCKLRLAQGSAEGGMVALLAGKARGGEGGYRISTEGEGPDRVIKRHQEGKAGRTLQ